jgi:hypothetical protein
MLNPFGAPSLATSAKTGLGVYEALEKISERVLEAFKDRLPELYEGEAEPSFEPAEGGLVHALRDATERASPPSDVVIARIGTAGMHPSIPPETAASPPPSHAMRLGDADQVTEPIAPPALAPMAPAHAPVPAPARPKASPTLTSMPALGYSPGPNVLPAPIEYAMARAEAADLAAPRTVVEEPAAAAPVSASTSVPRSDGARHGVSFAELWPEGEHAMVRDLEDAISRGRYWRAIELCETLVQRVLASAAGLFGTTDAPRDAAVVPMLLGLDGRRYLAFRSIVREARDDGLITAREALSAYAFAVDCRLARSSIR